MKPVPLFHPCWSMPPMGQRASAPTYRRRIRAWPKYEFARCTPASASAHSRPADDDGVVPRPPPVLRGFHEAVGFPRRDNGGEDADNRRGQERAAAGKAAFHGTDAWR